MTQSEWSINLFSHRLPPPHRLGASSGLRPPTQDLGSTSSLLLSSPPATSDYRSLSTEHAALESTTEFTDSGEPPKPKRARLTSKQKQKQKPPATEEVHLQTHDGGPLQEFVFFLPQKLPRLIVQSRSALLGYVESTLTTYLGLWELSSEMKDVDVHFHPVYISEQLYEEYNFIARLLSKVVDKLLQDGCQSVGVFCLPCIAVHTCAQLELLLQPLVRLQGKCSVDMLLLLLKCSLSKREIASLSFKNVCGLLRKIAPTKVGTVSSDPAHDSVKEFRAKLQTELKKSKGVNISVGKASLDVIASSLSHLDDSERTQFEVKPVDPHCLLDSLNLGASCGAAGVDVCDGDVVPPVQQSMSPGPSSKTASSFSTDCTYSNDLEPGAGTYVSEMWNLSRLYDIDIDGTGTTIAVIDSGISYMHAAFKDKIVAVRNFVPSVIDDLDCMVDSDGHGTLCAGIAAGKAFYSPLSSSNPSSQSVLIPFGVAPGAKLVICKVVKTSNGDVDSEAFIRALKWLKELHTSGTRIDVVSISLASTYFSMERAQVISDLASLGVIITCCASNVGRLSLQPIAFPARLGHVLCIGAHDENGKPSSFSPVGRELDFLAPGDNIWGPGPGTVSPFAMDCASGTSCATPAVAGLVCLILHFFKHNGDHSRKNFQLFGKPLVEFVRNVWVMRELLKEMSSSPGYHSEEIGYGTLNVHRVLDRSPEEIVRVVNGLIEDPCHCVNSTQ